MSLVVLHIVTTKIGDWVVSTHSRHGSKEHDRKHVHIFKRGLSGEYSWNDDGSRHDKGKFPKSGQCIKRAKDLAASALGIPSQDLQFLTALDGGVYVSLHQDDPSDNIQNEFRSYVHKGKFIAIIGCERGLAFVIDGL